MLGGGAFACEAMREAVRNGARSVVMVTRQSTKYDTWHSHAGTCFPAHIPLVPSRRWHAQMAVMRLSCVVASGAHAEVLLLHGH